MTRRTVTDAGRIAALREALRAANGDWHDITALWSIQVDLDWLLARAEAVLPREAGLDVERLTRLTAFAEKVAVSTNDTAGTRAMARYALAGTLAGVVDEMRASTEPSAEP